MAYVSNNLSELGNVIGGRGKYWTYITADSLGAVCASGYISDAGKKRILAGDIVFVLSGTLSTLLSANPSVVAAGVSSEFASGASISWQPCVVTSVSPVTSSTGVPTAAATATLSQTTLQALTNLPRNILDCSDFTTNPWQIATSFNGTSATPTLTADRWNANSGGSLTWTAGRTSNTTVPGFSTSYDWGRSAGDTHTTGLSFGQVIESVDAIRVQGLPVSLSFWVAADANYAAGATGGTFIASILSGTGTNESSGKMFSGAWSGQTTVATQTITPTTGMTRIGPITGVVPTGCTQLGVAFSYSATTAATSPGLTAGAHESLQFMGVQLEAGGMTSFEHIEVAEVVNIATRYLQVIAEPTAGIVIGAAQYNGATSTAQVHIPLASPMRQAPTLTFTAGGYAIADGSGPTGYHTISAAGLSGATTGAVTLTVTAAATFSAGNTASPQFMVGRSTNSGTVILSADF